MAAKGLTGYFAAGAPILTPEGPKPIETLEPCDGILTAHEDDIDCHILTSHVSQAFRRLTSVWTVRIGGRSIQMTPGHPLHVKDRC